MEPLLLAIGIALTAERVAIQELKHVSVRLVAGHVIEIQGKSSAELSDHELRSLRFCFWLKSLSIYGPEMVTGEPKLTGAFTEHIKTLPLLAEVTLYDVPGLGDEVFEALAKCASLRRLKFRTGIPISARAVKALASIKKLEDLTMHEARFTEEGQKELRRLTQLKRLDLNGCRLKDSIIADLRENKGLTELYLGYMRLSDGAFREIEGFRQLRVLWMPRGVSDKALLGVSKLSELRELTLSGSQISDEGVRRLGRLEKLETLVLNDTPVTGKGVARLAELKNLKVLDLAWTAIGDGDLAPIGRMESLRRLGLHGTRISDKAVKELAAMEMLELIDVSGTDMTAEGIRRLKTKLPKCEVKD